MIISKQWKISDTNIEHMKTFINLNEPNCKLLNLSTKKICGLTITEVNIIYHYALKDYMIISKIQL